MKIAKLLKPLTASGGVSAFCATISLVVGLPAAIVSCSQALRADKRAGEMQQLVASAQRAASAAEANARIARDELAEMRIRNGIGQDQVRETARNASAAEKSANIGNNQLGAMQGTRTANETSARIAAEQLAAANAANREAMRPRIVWAETSLNRLAVGTKTQVTFSMRNDGRSLPRSMAMWSSMVWNTFSPAPKAPPCGSGTWDDIGVFTLGHHFSTMKTALDKASYEKYVASGTGFYAYGALCYTDESGTQHRTDFCSIVRSNTDILVCPGTPSPN